MHHSFYFAVRLITKVSPTITTAPTTPNTRSSPLNNSRTSSIAQDSQVESMATKVKDVLPQVPLKVIREDLSMSFITVHTNETISFILNELLNN